MLGKPLEGLRDSRVRYTDNVMIALALALQASYPSVVPRTLTSECMNGYELACTDLENAPI